MPEYTIVPSDVLRQSGTSKKGVIDATHAAGRVVYEDPVDKILKLSDASALQTAVVTGILMCDGTTGQELTYAKTGSLIFINTGVIGDIVVLSAANSGGMASSDVLVATNHVVILGKIISAGLLRFQLDDSNVIKQ